MVKILDSISQMIIPLFIFYIVGFGILQKVSVYELFIEGAKKGIKTVVHILPTLIGLMIGVGIFRSSGLLELVSNILKILFRPIGIPGEIIPVVLVRLFSSSAATGLCLDLFKQFGPDSLIGKMVSIMMSSTETVFYTLSVYFMSVKIYKTRYTMTGCILTVLAGTAASLIFASFI